MVRQVGERFRILPFDRQAAILSARMATYLEARGLAIPERDIFIAASAIEYGAGIVITRDGNHFGRLTPFGLTVLEA